ncbi:TIGR03943 family putative permease subunit [Pseudonocardia sp.]|uniref:TIGR03943 family putative permease subunit n=1 Tax=Pseudonocardia sp. TaxID=60912 RepID=UPI003D0E0225
MSREARHTLLLLLGGALARIALDGTFLRYVRPDHRWLLLGAGVAMILLAGLALWRERRAPEHDDHAGPDRHVPWLLLLPVLALALVPPPALGADAVTRAGDANPIAATATFDPLPRGLPEPPLGEVVARAVAGPAGGLDGREVAVTGFVVRRGAAVDLVRLHIACCAADARPHRLHLAGDTGTPQQDTWLRVRGHVEPGSATAANRFVPTLVVTSVQVVPAPPDPYEY